MVKRKRLPNAPSQTENPQQNGMILEGIPSQSGESVHKKCGQSKTPDVSLCQSTRSKQQQKSLAESSSSLDLNNSGAAEEQQQQQHAKDDDKPASNVKCPNQITRTSTRITKPSCRSASSPTQTSRKAGSSRCTSLPDPGKTRRSWELWSVEDKNAFFEALSEYGKDFESIQHYICQKNKKKNHPLQMIKNKDQVRHFYYRTWHKISKYLDIGDDVKKQTQELYGLINYGELRKKIGGRLDEKSSQKLNELILNGATTVRLKGKNLRVKTPVCRALKKLINVDDSKEEQLKFPLMITMEIQPQTNAAWTKVQSIAHNPRLRMTVSLQRRLSSVLNYLQARWKSPRMKQKENVNVAESSLVEESATLLRVLPKKDAPITLVSMKTPSDNVTNTQVSLQNYRENVLQKNVGCSVDHRRRQPKDTVGKDESKSVDDDRPNSVSKGLSEASGVVEESTPSELAVVNPVEDTSLRLAVGQDKAAVDLDQTKSDSCVVETSVDTSAKKLVDKPKSIWSNITNLVEPCQGDVEAEAEGIDEQISAIRHGWTIKEAGALTIGEIYVMLGNPSRIVLEYCWETDGNLNCHTNRASSHSIILSKLMHVGTMTLADLSKPKQEKQPSPGGNSCHCGHTCSSSGPAFKLPLLTGSSLRAGGKGQKSSVTKSPNNKDTAINDICCEPSSVRSQKEHPHILPSKNSSPILQPKKPLANSDAAFKEQLDRFLPINKKTRGGIRKSVVVQRELPLLPKTIPTHSMMTLRIVPTASQLAGSFVPVISNATLSSNAAFSKIVKFPLNKVVSSTSAKNTSQHDVPVCSSPSITVNSAVSESENISTNAKTTISLSPLSSSSSLPINQNIITTPSCVSPILKLEVQPLQLNSGTTQPLLTSHESKLDALSCENENSLQMNMSSLTTTLHNSPPNISSLLDISIPGCENFHMEGISVSLESSEKLLDISLNNSNSTFLDAPVNSSPATSSPDKGSTSALENVWLNGENEEISLSSLLGNLESPMKQNSGGGLSSSNEHDGGATSDPITRLSTDVDNHFQTMMNESSLDYISKFADLAAQIAETSGSSSK